MRTTDSQQISLFHLHRLTSTNAACCIRCIMICSVQKQNQGLSCTLQLSQQVEAHVLWFYFRVARSQYKIYYRKSLLSILMLLWKKYYMRFYQPFRLHKFNIMELLYKSYHTEVFKLRKTYDVKIFDTEVTFSRFLWVQKNFDTDINFSSFPKEKTMILEIQH